MLTFIFTRHHIPSFERHKITFSVSFRSTKFFLSLTFCFHFFRTHFKRKKFWFTYLAIVLCFRPTFKRWKIDCYSNFSWARLLDSVVFPPIESFSMLHEKGYKNRNDKTNRTEERKIVCQLFTIVGVHRAPTRNHTGRNEAFLFIKIFHKEKSLSQNSKTHNHSHLNYNFFFLNAPLNTIKAFQFSVVTFYYFTFFFFSVFNCLSGAKTMCSCCS